MNLRKRATIIPLVFFVCGAIGITILYRSIKQAEHQRLQMATEITAEQVGLRLEAWIDARVALVELMADQHFSGRTDIDQRFSHQAQSYIDLYPGFQALNFIDRQWVIRIVTPAAGNAAALGKDLHNHPTAGVIEALKKAEAERSVTRPPIIDLLQGGKGIVTYCPLLDKQGRWLGFVNGVFRVRKMIDSCLHESVLRTRFSYRLTDNQDAVAYEHEAEHASASGPYSVVVPVRIVDRNWDLHLSPVPSYVHGTDTWADEMMAGVGIVLLVFLALVLRALLVRQQELHESQAKYRLLVENQVDMVVQLDAAGNHLYVSPSYCEKFGCTEDELLGSSCLALIHPDDRDRIKASFASLHQPPHRSHAEHRVLNRDGTVWHSWTNVAVLDDNGNLTAINAVGRDITRRRELEDQLQLSRKMQAVGQLAGGIAHDFNNLLQVMLGNLQFAIEDTDGDSQTAADLQEIKVAIDKAMILSRQLLAFACKQDLQPKREDLNGLVERALEQLQRQLPSTTTLTFEPADKPVVARVDRGQAELILHNLCDNARAALTAEGTIRISTAISVIEAATCEIHRNLRPGQYATLVVADNGCGMSAEVLEHAFEPFFTTKEVGAGTGLGLATIYGIVQQHHGDILAESAEGRGSTFTVLFPQESVADPEPMTSSSAAATNHENILLAEDNKSVRDLAVRVLQRAGYKVLVAEDGKQAVEIFSEHKETVDLVILDMIMPVLGGRQAYDQIIAMRPEVPVLFASGYDPTTLIETEELPPGIDTLMKPYGIPDLLQKVRDILNRSALPD